MLALLDDIPVFDDNAVGVKKTCKEILEETGKKLEYTSGNDLENQKTEWFPLATLIEYLSLLTKDVYRLRRLKDDTFSYWATEIVRGYFKLAGLLVPSFKDNAESKAEDKQKSCIFDYQNMWVVCTLSMVEYMLPIYFTAKMLQQNLESTEILHKKIGSSYYIQQGQMDERLRNMYRGLLKNDNAGPLSEMMEMVCDKVVKIYFEYLEGAEHE